MTVQYAIMVRKWKKSRWGTTHHKFARYVQAQIFAAGYEAALHDVGLDYYVKVEEVQQHD